MVSFSLFLQLEMRGFLAERLAFYKMFNVPFFPRPNNLKFLEKLPLGKWKSKNINLKKCPFFYIYFFQFSDHRYSVVFFQH